MSSSATAMAARMRSLHRTKRPSGADARSHVLASITAEPIIAELPSNNKGWLELGVKSSKILGQFLWQGLGSTTGDKVTAIGAILRCGLNLRRLNA